MDVNYFMRTPEITQISSLDCLCSCREIEMGAIIERQANSKLQCCSDGKNIQFLTYLFNKKSKINKGCVYTIFYAPINVKPPRGEAGI
jgi:hypothetical protein